MAVVVATTFPFSIPNPEPHTPSQPPGDFRTIAVLQWRAQPGKRNTADPRTDTVPRPPMTSMLVALLSESRAWRMFRRPSSRHKAHQNHISMTRMSLTCSSLSCLQTKTVFAKGLLVPDSGPSCQPQILKRQILILHLTRSHLAQYDRIPALCLSQYVR